MPRATTLLSLITACGLALAGCGTSSDRASAAGSSSSPTTGGAPAASARFVSAASRATIDQEISLVKTLL